MKCRPQVSSRLLSGWSCGAALAALLIMLSASVIPAEAQPGYITTVAGGGTGGDGGAAVAAALLQPGAVAMDAAGNLYIADTDAQRVRKVNSSTGIITTVAGNGSPGSGGDGGPATAASLNYPVGVAVDSGGNLYITEFFGHRVRKVSSATGLISTYAGNGTQAFGGDGGAATAASLDSPWGVSVDPVGNLYIADSGNNRIRKVTAATGVISTIAGSSSGFSGDGGLATAATLADPTDVCVGGDGNFYIADFGNNRIRKIIASSGIISTVAGNGSAAFGGDGGQATSAQINQPYGVAADPDGNIYIADSYSHRIRYVAAATGVISTIAGTGTASFGGDGGLAINASFELPLDVAIAGGSDLLIADYGNARVRRLTGRELPVITWATPSSIVYGTALSATQLNATASVAGTLVYNPAAGTVLDAGARTLSVAFTPTDEVTYSPVSKTVTIDVTKATPVITWANPAPISSSTPLSSTQLNATASVAGSFVYTPPAGTTLGVGNGQTLSTVFTPTNTVNYATANKQVTIDVTSGLPTGPPYTLTITPPTGGRVTGAGISCGAGGTTCAVTMPVALTVGIEATASSGYTFTGWSGDCSGTAASISVNLQGPRTCAATFTPAGGTTYALTIAPAPTGGTVTGNGLTCGAGGATCAVTLASGTTAALTAAPAAGYTFTSWGGSCSGTSATTSVLMNAAKSCSATFTASGGTTYALTITPAPTGGTVTGNGLSCGAGGATCAVTLASGTTAALTAAPAAGYTFTSWGGSCSGTSATTSVLMDAAKSCSATFTASGGGLPTGPPYTLTITPPTGGKVTGAGISCGAGGTACAVTMPVAMTVGIQATASTGLHVHGLVGRLQRDVGVDFGQLAGRADVHGDVRAAGRHVCADDCAGADGRDGDGERADVRGGRRDVRGDAGERNDGGADGGAGGGVYVHELGRVVQRDQCDDQRADGCGEELQRDVHGERGHDLRADDCAGADGRDGDGERADVRRGRRDVRGDAPERDDGGADGGAGGGLYVYELGRVVQRDQCDDQRADGCGEELQRDVHGERGRAADGAAVYADDHAADGRAGERGGD